MISQWGYDNDFNSLYLANKKTYNELTSSKILVTGATGLVGTCLTEFLIFLKKEKNIDITITALSSSKSNLMNRFEKHIASGDVNIIEHDIRLPFSLIHSFDTIFHAASVANPSKYENEPVDVIDVIVQGTRNVLELAKSCKARVLYISTVEVYGDISHIQNDVTEDTFGSLDPYKVRCSYTESKRLAETLCKAYEAQYDLNIRVSRLSKVYGPSNTETDNRVMAYILSCVREKKDVILNSDGTRIFSFCYVTDAVSGMMTALLNGASGEAYNISDANSVCSLREIAEYSAQLASLSVSLQPAGISEISKDTVVNSRKLIALGWTPTTGIYDGLRKQISAISN
ncbi:NAD-dependent epimerase/dehydratase family protein [Pseudochrobactrum sp. MP213Fo]|uniref:NAD-dependent epimerase/dehydratase family protein n=1 Tax=Pseudochrobactrum sp. MP213Fo TaxID=3022250 RepID=UPI003BA0CDF4